MSRFKRTKIKSSKKSSVSIDEKIALLNQELEKTGMSNVSEMMTTDNVYSTSTYVPPVDPEEVDVPDPGGDTGVTTDDWEQPLGNDESGNPAAAPPTSFPRIWNNPGYSDPTDGLLNKNNLNGDGANLPLFNLPDWQDPADVPAGAAGGVQIELGGMDPGVVGGYLDSDGFHQTTGKLGGDTFKTHPELFKPVNYWRVFSIYNPFIDSYWPNNSLGRTPQYQGIVKGTENGGYALFTAHMYIGGGRTQYTINGNPPGSKDPIRRGTEDEPIYPGPIANLFNLGKRAFDWLKGKADDFVDKAQDFGDKVDKGIEDFIDKAIDWTKETVDDVVDFGYEWLDENLDINENGQFDWNDTGQLINDALDKVTGKTAKDAFDRITAPLWDSIPNKPKDWIEDKMQDVNKKIMDGLNDLQKKFTEEDLQTSVNWMDKYADESRKTNKNNNGKKQPGEVDMTDYTTQEDLDHITTTVSPWIKSSLEDYKNSIGKPDEKQKKDLLKSTIDVAVSSAIQNKDGLANSMGGMPGSWIDDADIDELIETGNLTIHKGRQGDNAGYKFDQDTINPDPTMEFLTGLADVNMDAVGAGGMTSILGAMLGSKLGLKTHYSGDSSGSDSKDVQDTPPMSWKVTIPINTNVNENILNWRNGILVETTIKKKPLPFGGLRVMGFDGNLYPPMSKAQIKRKNFVVPKNKRHLLKKSKLKESLNEGVRLGLYEPEAMNVDLADIRKGIMPEYPKKPPAEMIDGYHEKSRIRPKEAKNIIPTLKIDKVDLIRNHRLKPSEADEMMNTIKMINDYIKKHPEDFIHAQMRYPVDDPRLAELNWKMDQMLDAGKEYLDSNFKENQTLFKRATERTKRNTALTNPDYIQKHYDELRGTTKPEPRINRKSPSRFFKKPKKKSSMEAINDKIKQLDKDLLI